MLILLAASVMSFLANLPDDSLGAVVNKQALLAGLAAMIVVAMFRYLQMMLLLTISILAIGANLPSDLAAALGISQTALLVSLAVLVSMALINRVVNLLPTVKEEAHTDNPNERSEIFEAISKGDQAALQNLLTMGINVNFHLNGMTPLHLAAEKGYPEIVQRLIRYGADYQVKNSEGKTALEVALAKKKFIKTTEILHNAVKYHDAANIEVSEQRADADLWRDQYR